VSSSESLAALGMTDETLGMTEGKRYGSENVLIRNTAICPRVLGAPGQ
jgi:hypothetical protein